MPPDNHHHYQQLIDLFDRCFATTYQTRLVKGDDEPIYLPADGQTPYHRLIFAHGFYASALHEIAHWCIAGKQRRQQIDLGYWYCPDGRSATQQIEFEHVEIKPQALEWLFCAAAGYRFNVSCDNLAGDIQPDLIAFQRRVHQQVICYLQQGIPARAAHFIQALHAFYRTPALTADAFACP